MLGAARSEAAPAASRSETLIAAAKALDTAALARLAGGASQDAQLARGILEALRGNDERAIRDLEAAARSATLEPALRYEAWQTLADVYHRDGYFSEAAGALEASRALNVRESAVEAASTARGLANARALSVLDPLRSEISPSAEATITRNAIQLPTSQVVIDGQVLDAVLDTGAANSVVSQSTADRLGLKILSQAGSVGSFGIGELPARFAAADTLSFAGGVFHGVPFIVLPDEALTFADSDGEYKMEAIIGLPILRRLGRLEFVVTQQGERLGRSSTSPAKSREPNLILAAAQPIALLRVAHSSRPLRMSIDTGGNRSSLTPLAGVDFPAILAGAVIRTSKVAGAGGVVSNETTRVLPSLDLYLDRQKLTLSDVYVAEGPGDCHGVLAQDALRSGGGYVIDFIAMRIEILPRAGTH
jgi:predicted aspartyl protease